MERKDALALVIELLVCIWVALQACPIIINLIEYIIDNKWSNAVGLSIGLSLLVNAFWLSLLIGLYKGRWKIVGYISPGESVRIFIEKRSTLQTGVQALGLYMAVSLVADWLPHQIAFTAYLMKNISATGFGEGSIKSTLIVGWSCTALRVLMAVVLSIKASSVLEWLEFKATREA
jgi:hypothetical protein